MKKVVVVAVIVIAALPIIAHLKPKPFDPQKFMDQLSDDGYKLSAMRNVDPPDLGSIRQITFQINGDFANLYHFDDPGKINVQMTMQQPDAGEKFVQQMGLRKALGAAPDPNKKVTIARNGMWMLVLMSDNGPMSEQVYKQFKAQ